MPVLSRDREGDVPERSGREISRIFFGKNPVPGRWHLGTQTSNLGQNILAKSFLSKQTHNEKVNKECGELIILVLIFD